MYILHQQDSHHEKGEATAKEEYSVHIERIGKLAEMKYTAEAEDYAGDQHDHAYRSVHHSSSRNHHTDPTAYWHGPGSTRVGSFLQLVTPPRLWMQFPDST